VVLLTFAIWAGVVSIFVAQRLVGPLVGGRFSGSLDAAAIEVAYWVPWLLLAPVLLALARRYPLTAERWRRNVPLLVAAGFAFAVVEAAGSALTERLAFDRLLSGTGRTLGPVGPTIAVYTVIALWKYWVFVAIANGFAAARRSRERTLHAARLESQLVTARLQALEARLHPHFLFNALHSASMLALVDPDGASRLLARLADLLRHTLRTPAAEVTLEQELELVRRYLDIERIRFPDRLRVDVAVEPEALGARVPNLLLQPLVENAIRHGIAPVSTAGSLTIRGRRAGAELLVEVEDDGPGPPPGWSLGSTSGLGLTATAARLALLYPGANRLELATGPAGGCLATVTLPFSRQ
jgi:LytS/YehU family sensor histidine kinase